jgi:pilus assembly protein Flp/PilA
MRKACCQLAGNERGVTSIEYAMIASLVAVGLLVALTAIGIDLKFTFDQISTAFTGEISTEDTSDNSSKRDCEQAHNNCGQN